MLTAKLLGLVIAIISLNTNFKNILGGKIHDGRKSFFLGLLSGVCTKGKPN
jgi:hypothetical protein